jgi:pyridoxal phosphate enzyme (YggS family)
MHQSVKNIIDLNNKVKQKIQELNYTNYNPKIIAVSKTFSMDNILPLIEYGHQHFGENKVQEAYAKWVEIKNKKNDLILHMIGRLQSNKVKQAVKIFDYIHSLDSLKLAKKIAQEQNKQKKKLKFFIQVNIGEEIQKNGLSLNEANELANQCKDMNLDVIGLMCLPPINDVSSKYFSIIKKKNDDLNFKSLSLGMSDDYIDAIHYKSTFFRIGTKIFGKRN